MTKKTILLHIDRELTNRKRIQQERSRCIHVELDYLDQERLDRPMAELLWEGTYQVHARTEDVRIEWLEEWRQRW